MIDLGTTEFHISTPSLPRDELKSYSTHLFERWEGHLEKALIIPDYSLALNVEEGSVKGVGRIAALLGAVYFGIGQYGSFVSGLQILRTQISTASTFLAEQAGVPFDLSATKPEVRKRGGALAALHRLFVKVQRGDITPEEALGLAEGLLGDDAKSTPGFMRKLEESLNAAPRFHEQLLLPLEPQDLPLAAWGVSPRPAKDRKKVATSHSPSKPTWPPPPQFRIEVWRESKRMKRNIRVVDL